MKLECFSVVLFSSIVSSMEIFTLKENRQEMFFTDVNRVFSGLEKAVLFYEQNGDDLNLDAFFGLRIAQGL